jgi:hypothetical protein
MANIWSKRENGQPFQPADFFPSLRVDRLEDQSQTDLQKQIEANINSMKMLTWNLQAQGYKPDPSLSSDEQAEFDKLMQVAMPAD